MKMLTDNQRRVLDEVERAEVPRAVAEIAHSLNLTPSSVRNALMTLSRYTDVTPVGTALSGGQTWGVRRKATT